MRAGHSNSKFEQKDFTMNQLNKIQPDDIKRLGADGLVRLLDLLLHGEARNRLIGKHGIFVPFQISVIDGGRDGKWEAPICTANTYRGR